MTAQSIIIENHSGGPIDVFVSKYSNADGSDNWYTLQQGQKDSWVRKWWELVAFRIPGADNKRAGVYVPSGSFVKFNSLTNIAVD